MHTSNETASAIYKELSQIAGRLNTIRWQVLPPIGNESARQDLINELDEVIMQASIARDNLQLT